MRVHVGQGPPHARKHDFQQLGVWGFRQPRYGPKPIGCPTSVCDWGVCSCQLQEQRVARVLQDSLLLSWLEELGCPMQSSGCIDAVEASMEQADELQHVS